jgi:alpha-1,6-mannosyltransferase
MTSFLGTRVLTSARFKKAFFISAGSLAALLALLTWLATISKAPVWRLVAVAAAAHLAYGLCLFFAWKMSGPRFFAWPALALSLGMRLILVPAPPAFSDDVYRYVWDGTVLLHGTNPYRFSPDAPQLEPLRNRYWKEINNKPLRTIYPPLGEAVFGAIAFLCPHPVGFKIFSALADVGVVCLVILLAGGRFRSRGDPIDAERNKTAFIAGLAYGLNPLACIETGMSGHLDPAAVFSMLLALFFLKRERNLIFSTLIGMGTGIKLAPVLALPIVRHKRIKSWLIFFSVIIALYLPFSSVGLETVKTLDTFSRRWEGNAGLFSMINWMTSALLNAIAGVEGPDTMIHVKILDGAAAALQGTFFSLHKDGGFDPAAPGAFALSDLSLALSKLVLGLSLATVVAVVSLRRLEPVRAATWIFGALIVCTPVLHPWYLLWILPLAALLGQWPWMVFAALQPLAYLPLDKWWSTGIWRAPIWIQLIEWGALVAGGVIYYLIASNRRKTNSQ